MLLQVAPRRSPLLLTIAPRTGEVLELSLDSPTELFGGDAERMRLDEERFDRGVEGGLARFRRPCRSVVGDERPLPNPGTNQPCALELGH